MVWKISGWPGKLGYFTDSRKISGQPGKKNCRKNNLRTLSEKFLRVESCHPENSDFLGLCWEGKGSQVPRPTLASGGIFFFNLDDHLGIGTSNCWAFPALEKEIYLVLLNKKDGDRCWFLGIGTPCIYWRGYIYNEQKNTDPSKLNELISCLVYLTP